MTVDDSRFRREERKLWESVGAAPTERVLELSRTGVTVRVQEVGEGPPVLFVHGASNCGTSWAPLVGRLDGYRCILLDRPGCGLSAALPHRLDDVGALATFAEDLLVDVFDALDIDRAHLVVTSFGGYLGLRTAAAHPDRVAGLVAMGWSIGAPLARTPLVMRIAAVPLIGRLLTALPPNERVVRSIFKSIGLGQALEAGRVTQPMLDFYLALLRDTATMRNELDAGPPILTALKGINTSVLLGDDVLGAIDVPVHFLWGEGDPLGGAEIARAFAARVPKAELQLVPGAGHAVWIDDPELAAGTVTRFCAATPV